MSTTLQVIYEDNHILAVNKTHHDLVQKDDTGDLALDDKVKQYLKELMSVKNNCETSTPKQ